MIRLTFLFFLIAVNLDAQSLLLPSGASGRASISLNGKWQTIIDPYETGFYDYRMVPFDSYDSTNTNTNTGYFSNYKAQNKTERVEYDFDKSQQLNVPGDWNSQDCRLDLYEGTIWYKKDFQLSKKDNTLYLLRFAGVNYRADVYVNGKKVGMHEGGFTPFAMDVTAAAKEGANFVVVKVDNKRFPQAVPTINTDWWNYGGITRDVELTAVPASAFINSFSLQAVTGAANTLRLNVQLQGRKASGQKIRLQVPEAGIDQSFTANAAGEVDVQVKVKKLQLWSPERPKLYDVKLTAGEDTVTDRIGFRTIQTKGADILLNGKSVFLRGICIHEEIPQRKGRAFSKDDALMLLTRAKELNCNFVRLAHYPHNEYMTRLADEMGLMVWSEIPVYWTIDWKNPGTLANAKNQLNENISRDINRASIIIWSVGNETPVSPERTEFMRQLVLKARSLDSTRLLGAAMEKHTEPSAPLVQIVEDPLAEFIDVTSFNQYVGWYDGLPEKCQKVTWNIKYNKPVIISEFGGDALYGLHGDSLTRWSEEYQASLYRNTLDMLEKIPQLRGITPWILFDFRSPKRHLPGVQDFWNRKGLISERGDKKQAFYILKDYYNKKEKQYNPK